MAVAEYPELVSLDWDDEVLRRILLAGAVAAALATNASSAAAQSVHDFYRGKTVTLLIGIGVGGGTDAWARTLGEYIGRHIPGNPSVVPENMPGAAGLKMTDYIYNAAPQGGSVIGLPNAGICSSRCWADKAPNSIR